jgi:hypothetical protein
VDMRIHSRNPHANTLNQLWETWDGEISSGRRDQYSFHLSTSIDVRAKVFAPIQPRTNTVSLSWYTGQGGR